MDNPAEDPDTRETEAGAAAAPGTAASALPHLEPGEIASVLEESASRNLFASLLTTYYIPLETWYLRTIIFKSHRLSTLDSSSQSPQHTAPDDVFYILKSVLMRVCSVGEIHCLKKMSNVVQEVVERDYVGVMKGKLEDVYSARGPGAGQRGVAAEKAERENRTTFMVCSVFLSECRELYVVVDIVKRPLNFAIPCRDTCERGRILRNRSTILSRLGSRSSDKCH